MAPLSDARKVLRHFLAQLALESSAQVGKSRARAAQALEESWTQVAKRAEELKTFLQSEEFEQDLDELAEKLGIHYSEHPRQRDALKSEARMIRVRAKLGLLFRTSGQQITGARAVLPFLLGRPRLAKHLGGAMAVAKSAEILIQSWKVFRKKRRPKTFEVK